MPNAETKAISRLARSLGAFRIAPDAEWGHPWLKLRQAGRGLDDGALEVDDPICGVSRRCWSQSAQQKRGKPGLVHGCDSLEEVGLRLA
ncbi:hypothetical protein ACN9MD_03905 [Stenotrophomonas maltophilia]|uniref:hypothetical protein n=1 Tax=Stenotrophomonas maltophilia TaxID=40324 RepID=UPI003CF78CA5